MRKNVALTLTKISFFAMLTYSVLFLAVLRIQISNVTMLLGLFSAFFMIVDMAINNFDIRKLFTKEVIILLALAIYSFMTSLVFAEHKFSAFNGLFQLLQNMILMVVTVYIILRDQKISFVVGSFVLIMLAMAIYAIGNMGEFDVRLTLTEETNANVLGHNAMCALMFLPLFIKPNKKWFNILLILVAVLFVLTIVFSGSRMSFICMIVFGALFFARILPESRNKGKNKSRLIASILGLGAFVLLLYLLIPLFKGTLLYERMQSLFDLFNDKEADGAGRIYLYQRAWELFKTNPIFGIGYANFAPLNHGAYTHSTYAEILSCVGLIGTGIYIAFYCQLKNRLKKNEIEKDKNQITRLTMVIAFIVILVLGIGEIVFYKINYFIIFGLITGYGLINKKGN